MKRRKPKTYVYLDQEVYTKKLAGMITDLHGVLERRLSSDTDVIVSGRINPSWLEEARFYVLPVVSRQWVKTSFKQSKFHDFRKSVCPFHLKTMAGVVICATNLPRNPLGKVKKLDGSLYGAKYVNLRKYMKQFGKEGEIPKPTHLLTSKLDWDDTYWRERSLEKIMFCHRNGIHIVTYNWFTDSTNEELLYYKEEDEYRPSGFFRLPQLAEEKKPSEKKKKEVIVIEDEKSTEKEIEVENNHQQYDQTQAKKSDFHEFEEDLDFIHNYLAGVHLYFIGFHDKSVKNEAVHLLCLGGAFREPFLSERITHIVARNPRPHEVEEVKQFLRMKANTRIVKMSWLQDCFEKRSMVKSAPHAFFISPRSKKKDVENEIVMKDKTSSNRKKKVLGEIDKKGEGLEFEVEIKKKSILKPTLGVESRKGTRILLNERQTLVPIKIERAVVDTGKTDFLESNTGDQTLGRVLEDSPDLKSSFDIPELDVDEKCDGLFYGKRFKILLVETRKECEEIIAKEGGTTTEDGASSSFLVYSNCILRSEFNNIAFKEKLVTRRFLEDCIKQKALLGFQDDVVNLLYKPIVLQKFGNPRTGISIFRIFSVTKDVVLNAIQCFGLKLLANISQATQYLVVKGEFNRNCKEVQLALSLNIPIVKSDWLIESAKRGKILSVDKFYHSYYIEGVQQKAKQKLRMQKLERERREEAKRVEKAKREASTRAERKRIQGERVERERVEGGKTRKEKAETEIAKRERIAREEPEEEKAERERIAREKAEKVKAEEEQLYANLLEDSPYSSVGINTNDDEEEGEDPSDDEEEDDEIYAPFNNSHEIPKEIVKKKIRRQFFPFVRQMRKKDVTQMCGILPGTGKRGGPLVYPKLPNALPKGSQMLFERSRKKEKKSFVIGKLFSLKERELIEKGLSKKQCEAVGIEDPRATHVLWKGKLEDKVSDGVLESFLAVSAGKYLVSKKLLDESTNYGWEDEDNYIIFEHENVQKFLGWVVYCDGIQLTEGEKRILNIGGATILPKWREDCTHVFKKKGKKLKRKDITEYYSNGRKVLQFSSLFFSRYFQDQSCVDTNLDNGGFRIPKAKNKSEREDVNGGIARKRRKLLNKLI